MDARTVFRIVAGWGLAAAALAAAAQGRPPTTEQLGKDPGALRQEAEQQRAQQQRSQQEQSRQQADQQWNDTLRGQQQRANADIANAEAVRRTWQQRPPLAPEKNPLLGRWQSLGPGGRQGAPGVSPEIASLANALIGGITGGLCESMLGRGTVEFRPDGAVAISPDGGERPMYRADYRGGGSRVVVLPRGGTSFTHMIIDFEGPQHATVAAVGCRLSRAGAARADASHASTTTAATAATMAGAGPQWLLLGTSEANGGMDVYVSRASIRRAGDSARMSDLWDFKSRHAFDGKPFLSARNDYEYDCAHARQRMLGSTGFTGNMGQGAVIGVTRNVGGWEPVGASGVAHEHWKVACARP